jgi:hypothetical protein
MTKFNSFPFEMLSLSDTQRDDSHDDLVSHIALQFLVWQADTILYPNLIANTTILAEDGDAFEPSLILDDACCVTANRRRCTLDPRPCTDSAVPSNDRVQHTGILLDLRVLKCYRLFDANSRTDDSSRSNGYVWSQLSRWIDLCGEGTARSYRVNALASPGETDPIQIWYDLFLPKLRRYEVAVEVAACTHSGLSRVAVYRLRNLDVAA